MPNTRKNRRSEWRIVPDIWPTQPYAPLNVHRRGDSKVRLERAPGCDDGLTIVSRGISSRSLPGRAMGVRTDFGNGKRLGICCSREMIVVRR